MRRLLFLFCLVLATVSAGFPHASGGQALDYDKVEATRNRVSDLLFPNSVGSRPYSERFILRFPDPDNELVLVIYPGGQSELVEYRVEGLGGESLFGYIWNALGKRPQTSNQEIANTIRVTTKLSVVDSQKLRRALSELKDIKISPFFETRIAVDQYSDYDYWFDSGGESVHYRIHGVSQQSSQDELVHWMIKFRESLK